MGFELKQKNFPDLCETWQVVSYSRLNPFDELFYCQSKSHGSHSPCNGQDVSLKRSQTVIALFYYFSMAPSKSFRLLPIVHVHVLSETDQLSKTGHVA